MSTCRSDCLNLDAQDPLRDLRDLFDLPKDTIYLDGNSLGPLPKATPARVAATVQQAWGQDLVRSWNSAGWFELPLHVGDKIGQFIGAEPGQTVAADTTSTNLYKALKAALALRPGRMRIVSERSNFPTDLYIAQGIARDSGHRVELLDQDDIASALNDEVAVLMLTHVNYRTGAMHDMAALTRAAHDAGALVIWDLAHSAGAVPVDLLGADADFAVGCGYKYFNGGPGAPAFVWVHPRHVDAAWQPLSGWWGHASPFAFDPQYEPAPGIARYQCGTQAIISLSALDAGMDTFLASQALGGMAALRAKSLALTDLFMQLVDDFAPAHGLRVVTPREHAKRGSQVSLSCAHGAYAMVQALIARGVIGDFRSGDAQQADILRFGFTPLYLRFIDVWDAAQHLREVLQSGEWQAARFQQRQAVT